MVETDASDFAIASILSPMFEDGKLHPVRGISRKLSSAELNYNIPHKEMLTIVFSLTKWRYFLQEAEYKTIVYSDHQNLTYFKTAVSLNRRHASWAEELQTFNFDPFYRNCSSTLKSDTLSRFLVYIQKEGGTTATGNSTLLRQEQRLEIGDIKIRDNRVQVTNVEALDVEQQLPEAKERIQQNTMLDEDYRAICKQLSSGGITDTEYQFYNEILCCLTRVYMPKGLRKRVVESEHDSKVAGHFGQERSMELLTRNFC